MQAFEVWCQTMTGSARFRPDPAEIAKELTDHFEDHPRALERFGCDQVLAEERSMTRNSRWGAELTWISTLAEAKGRISIASSSRWRRITQRTRF